MGQVGDMVQVAQDTGACCVFSMMTNNFRPDAASGHRSLCFICIWLMSSSGDSRGSSPVRFTDAVTGTGASLLSHFSRV